MANFLRLIFMIVMLLAVGLGAAMQQPESARDLGLDPQRLADLKSSMLSDGSAAGKIDDKDRAIVRRIYAKEGIIHELIDGRITAREAVAQFRQLNEAHGAAPGYPLEAGDTEDERACRQIMSWAQAHSLSGPGVVSTDFIGQLAKELRRYRERNGAVLASDFATP
jgi:hypothetical protein